MRKMCAMTAVFGLVACVSCGDLPGRSGGEGVGGGGAGASGGDAGDGDVGNGGSDVGGDGGSGGGFGGSGGSGGSGANDVGGGGSGGSGGGGDCVPKKSPCDKLPQCGCGFGQACYNKDDEDGRICLDAGDVGQSMPCEYRNDCAEGLTCIDGGCKPFCSNDTDCSGAGAIVGQCAGILNSIGVCVEHCRPWDTNSCSHGLGCVVVRKLGHKPGTSECAAVGTGTGSDSCDWVADCAPGYECVGTPGKCQKYCRIGYDSDCPLYTSCLGFAGGGLFWEYQEIGSCR
ncbi:MAG: hypothetical protein FWD57_00565 [Polyangiaceae bacterium]|nr:hypothetical protein [Polyangiaceae bacterium]